MCRRCTENEPHRLKKSSVDYKLLRRDTGRDVVVSKTLPYDVSATLITYCNP